MFWLVVGGRLWSVDDRPWRGAACEFDCIGGIGEACGRRCSCVLMFPGRNCGSQCRFVVSCSSRFKLFSLVILWVV